MRKRYQIPVFLFAALFIFTNTVCKAQTNNSLIPKQFLVFSKKISVVSANDSGFVENVGNKNIVDILFNKVLNNKTIVYDINWGDPDFPYNLKITDTLTISKIKNRLSKHQYDESDKITENLDFKNVTKFNFIEEWNFDAENFKFSKNVIAYQPVSNIYTQLDKEEAHPQYRIAFTVLNQKKNALNPKDLVIRVKHEVSLAIPYEDTSFCSTEKLNLLDNIGLQLESSSIPYWTATARYKFIKTIFNKAFSGAVPLFNLFDNKYMPLSEARVLAGNTKESVFTIDPDTGGEVSVIVDHEFDAREIKSVIFLENWYLNEETLQFDKEIVGIAPVRHFTTNEDNKIKKNIAFVLYFDYENKEKLEKAYHDIISDPHFNEICDGLELFHNLILQTKNQQTKTYCTEKQKQLYDKLINLSLSIEEKVKLTILFEKLGLNSDKKIEINPTTIDDLKQTATIYRTISDSTKNEGMKKIFLQKEQKIYQKIIDLEETDVTIEHFMDLNEKLNIPFDLNSLKSKTVNTKKYYAYYFHRRIDKKPEYKKYALQLYQEVFSLQPNCDNLKAIDKVSYTVDKKNIDKLNDNELACYADNLAITNIYKNDSLQKAYYQNALYAYKKLNTNQLTTENVKNYFRCCSEINEPFDYKLFTNASLEHQAEYQLFTFEYLYNNILSSTNLEKTKDSFDKYITLDTDYERIWSLLHVCFLRYRESEIKDFKSALLDRSQTLLDKLMKHKQAPEYKIIQLEINELKNVKTDINTLFKTDNINEMKYFAEYFAYGDGEYFTAFVSYYSQYQYAINHYEIALTFYERLSKKLPLDSIRTSYSNVYFGLTWYQILNNEISKAKTSAQQSFKMDSKNEQAVSALVVSALYDNNYNEAERICKEYKDKPCKSYKSYYEMLISHLKSINRSKSNENATKLLTFLNSNK